MTQDLWTSLEADRMASAVYDPFEGMTVSQYAGGYAQNFPAEAFAPESEFFTEIWQPWDSLADNLWEAGGGMIEYTSQKLPELLWERALGEIRPLTTKRVIDEGAGVTVVHTQAPQAGGAPAQPIQKIIPGKPPAKAAAMSTTVLIGAGLVGLYILTRK